jgi:Ca2+-binding EF-hand superfamily protein
MSTSLLQWRNKVCPSGGPYALVAFLIVACTMSLHADDGAREAMGRLRSEFHRLDQNRDLQLELGEFLVYSHDAALLRRDFVLLDFDRSGRLSREEFACLPGLVPPHLRGTMPDPMQVVIEDAVAALDESYESWDQRPEEFVSAHSFVANFLASISPQGKRFVTGRLVSRADIDADGQVSRAEARQFLEQQLGFRLPNGVLLREPTGRLLRYDRFLTLDDDRDDYLTRSEFSQIGLTVEPSSVLDMNSVANLGGDRDAAFAAIDRDRSGRISCEEYADPVFGAYFDPIDWFRAADTDLSASLDTTEMTSAVEANRRHLLPVTLSSFDDDHDQQISLREYRTSLLGQYSLPWDRRPVDQDRDGELVFDEFIFDESDQFQLQRWYFFHRIDKDRSGRLSADEFDFQQRRPMSIWLHSTSDAQATRLHENLETPICGWPSISPDGTQLLAHEHPASRIGESEIVLISLSSHHQRILCKGRQPSWSADGKRFVCERQDPTAGIWIMDAGGREGRRISPGHAPKWSPDGASIAFLNDNGVSIHQVESGETYEVVSREDHPFSDLGNDVAWSPDSRQLTVLGNLATTSQLLILRPKTSSAAAGATEIDVRHSFDVCCRGNLNWTTQNQILVAVREPRLNRNRLVSLAADSDSGPEPVSRLESIQSIVSAFLTADEKWFITVVEPEDGFFGSFVDEP